MAWCVKILCVRGPVDELKKKALARYLAAKVRFVCATAQ